MGIIALLPLLIQALPYIIQLVMLAEKLFSGEAQTGAQKKTFVLAALQAIFSGMKQVSTGGQKETWTELEQPVSMIVDGIAGILFKHNEQGGPN